MAGCPMTFDDFLTTVTEYHRTHPSQRYGQAVMNVLYQVRPDLYDRTTKERFDVFYTTDAAEIEAILAWLKRRFHDDSR